MTLYPIPILSQNITNHQLLSPAFVAHLLCSWLKHILDQGVADVQDLGELRLNLHVQKSTKTIRSSVTQAHHKTNDRALAELQMS